MINETLNQSIKTTQTASESSADVFLWLIPAGSLLFMYLLYRFVRNKEKNAFQRSTLRGGS